MPLTVDTEKKQNHSFPIELQNTTERPTSSYTRTLEEVVQQMRASGTELALVIENQIAYAIKLSVRDGHLFATIKRLSEDELRALVEQNINIRGRTHGVSVATLEVIGTVFAALSPLGKPIHLGIIQSSWEAGRLALQQVRGRYETQVQSDLTGIEFKKTLEESHKSRYETERRDESQKAQEHLNKLARLVSEYFEVLKNMVS